MKEPKITFKNVISFNGTDGYGVNADMYINGVLCYVVVNDGSGGEMVFNPCIYNNPKKELVLQNISQLDEYLKEAPEDTYIFNGEEHKTKMTLDWFTNKKLDEYEMEKEMKKMRKLFKTAIVFGVPKSPKYMYQRISKPIEDIADTHFVQNVIDNIKNKYCKDGVVILNNNLSKYKV